MGQTNGEAASKRVGYVLSLIAARDLEGLLPALALLTDKERQEAAEAVGDWSRTLRGEREQMTDKFFLVRDQGPAPWYEEWYKTTWTVACAAVIGTFSAPAAAATVLVRVARVVARHVLPADLTLALARERGLNWLPDLAGRLVDLLGPDDRDGWAALDQILRAYRAPAPSGDGFVLGWLANLPGGNHGLGNSSGEDRDSGLEQADWLQASPYLSDLLPRVFETDGAYYHLKNAGDRHGLLELSRREPVYRPLLIDGCLSRIALGGTAPALRPFGLLWAELAPDDGEVAARVAAYTAVAASAAPGLAVRALKALLALWRHGQLGLDDLLDLSAAVLARREKALVSAQLLVLARAVPQHPDRLQDILTAVTPATQHGVPEVRATAARILRKHVADAAPGAREQLIAAAAAAEADVRAERAVPVLAFSCATELPALPRPAPAQPLPLPPVDTGGLLEERLHELEELPWSGTVPCAPWAIALEPVLDGLVRLIPGDALDLVLPRISAILARRDLPALMTLAAEVAAGRCGDPALLVNSGIARLRIGELAARLSTDPVPSLVAVPTDTTGAIDPPVLLERLTVAEAEGWDPWPVDLDQALLRTARLVPTELAAKAEALTSTAGRRLARWWSPGDQAAWDGLIGVLLSRHAAPDAVATPSFTYAPVSHWLVALPYHHEAIARWLSPLLPRYDETTWRWLMTEDDMARLLLGAEPLGAGLHMALASCLAAPASEARDTATAVLAARLGQPATDAAALGAGLGAAFAAGHASLDRALPSLERVAAAQPERMWPVITAALPAVLAARPTRDFRLMQITRDLAGHLDRTETIAGLAEAARLKGRLGQAARELSSIMSGAPR